MFSASPIIFIKCWNWYHIKNNIRYKGNINNTSVNIFLIGGQKLPAMLLCLGEPSRRFLVVVLHFIFDLYFIFVSSFHFWSLFHFCSSFVGVLHSVVVLHSHFLFGVIPHPSVDYGRVFTSILYFQPTLSQSDSWHFHFPLSSCRGRYGLGWGFFTHRRFLPCAPSPTF